MTTKFEIDRREFLKTTSKSSAALILGFYLPAAALAKNVSEDQVFRPNAWIRISSDNQITVLIEIPEMGQGPRTVDTIILADELEADWSTIHVEQAPVIPETYKNLSTGGSGGTGTAWDYMRKVGAQAREMLITAAAQQWKVEKKDCRAENSTVLHNLSGRRVRYGELVEAASKLPVPKAETIALKQPADFRFIGKSMPRVDVPSKVNGSGVFGIDVRVPAMLFAVIARCPHFGGTVQSFDAAAANAVPGVRAVFPIEPLGFVPGIGVNINTAGGIAVVADSTWSAMQGRKALKISWDKGPNASETTERLSKQLKDQAVAPPSFVAVNRGNTEKALLQSAKNIEAHYEMPFQAHATMEPMNTTVHVREDGIEVWSPTQIGAKVQDEITKLSGIPAKQVTVHMTLCGGSFGRRYQWDYAAEAWQVAKEVNRPVQLLWTREDDMQHDFYRQYSYHRLSGGLDEQNNISVWSHRVVSTPIRAVFDPPDKLKDPKHVASQELSGADVLPYAVSNFRLDYAPVQSAVPRAWWRSVGHSFNAFVLECFVDELAHAAGRDPYEFRMNLLREDRRLSSIMWPDDPPLETRRFRAVMQLAADRSGWGTPLPPRTGRGIACCCSFGSYMAHVAEVSVEKDGTLHVRRVVSAVDCGTAVNPDGARAMTEGAINYALTPVLSGEITIKDGAVEQSNFDGYQVLRMSDAPDIEVHIAPSNGDPGGMGETGVPPLAPAVANAIFAATGKRIRRLPIDPGSVAATKGTS
ncbi:MAG TPA: xanthine dehydrogenase family protein molybdopterin-binding subunit [Candidatus Sulfotelmatobacter sp.]|nr:xanthine dehydrogenase family protein molybdopterin-binding subunit [Candidatus Sulfotelmatobacter sp.]